MSIIISNEFKQNIVNDYTSNIQPIKDLSLKYKLSYPTILKILKEYNIHTYTKQQLYSNGMNENFFSNIDSEEKAYFLGFFLADGCVYYSNKSPKIIFGLQQQDSYIVEIFHKLINAQTSLVYDNRGSGFISSTVSSYKMANDLSLYELDRPKCARPLPYIRIDLMNHLLRGFFDGDGCFTYRLAHPERKICNSYSGRISLITYYILKDDIINFLKYIGIENTRVERCNSKVFLEMVDIGRKNDILTFYNFIYHNATIYLSRKKEKFEQYFQLNKMI